MRFGIAPAIGWLLVAALGVPQAQAQFPVFDYRAEAEERARIGYERWRQSDSVYAGKRTRISADRAD